MNYKIYKLNKENKDFFIKEHFDTDRIKQVDDFLDSENSIAYFVSNEVEVVGYIYGYILPRFDGNQMMYIHSVDVHKEYRHQGIGTLMIDTMIHYAKEQEMLKVFLITNKSNQHAVALYTKTHGKTMYNDDVVFEWKL